ncbi:DUF1015 family protein [Nocardioides sp. 1609]|uniref:DUF1015 family protein n=1 Tax=Nocardioides sp. 1609 TaxID=2508327 RepID=UPI00106F31B3|nr:DUF1015 family protein [Nocardioides sp. 1609]
MESAAVTPPFVARPLRLAPFRALRLVPSRIGDPAASRLFARPYRDLASRLQTWEARGMITHDPGPALYVHEYTVDGITVRGLVGAIDVSSRAVRLEDRAILPHEGIYPAQADDLADRMEQMRVNPGPILLVQDSPAALRALLAQVRRAGPDHEITDRSGQFHRIWAITDPSVIAEVAELIAPTTALIADGHHRYAAYLRLQQRDLGTAADRGLAMIVDQTDTPLFLGAIHRVLAGSSVHDVEAAARTLGIRTTLRSHEEAVALLGPRTLVVTDTETWLTVHLELEGDRVEAEVLHDQLVPSLGHGPSRVTFHHTAQEALAQVEPDHGTAVLMPAPSVAQVQRVVASGRLFPEKATSFQPKPAFGAFIRSWRDEEPDPT